MKKQLLLATLALLGGAASADTVSEAFCRALNVEGLTFTTGGDALWTVTTENSHDGVSALQSGAIGDYQSTWFQTTIEGPRLVSFMWMVSSCGRSVSVICDGVVMRSIDGRSATSRRNYTTDWERQYIFIDSGSHIVQWNFGGWQYRGEDLARIDELQLGSIQDEIVLPSDLTALETYAFNGSTSLKSVTLPDSLTSIPDSWFNGCTGLSEIVIPKSVVSIGEYAFSDCTGLKTVTFLTTNLTTIGGSAFRSCSALETVTVPETVTSLGDSAFCECSALKSARLPSGLTATSDALFMDCSSLTDVTLPTAPIKIETSTFRNCTSLKTVDIPTSVITIGGYAFNSCSVLERVELPANLVTIGERVFQYCKALKSVRVPDNVTQMGDAVFEYCDELETVHLPTGITSLGAYMFQYDYKLKSVVIPESVSQIGVNAFRLCTSLKEMALPSTVTVLPDHLFGGCSSLEKVTCSDNVTSIGSYAFSDCEKLVDFTIPSHVTSIGSYAFNCCRKMSAFTLPEGLTSIPDACFASCESITSITIPSTVKRIEYHAFGRCTKLASVTLPEGLEFIGRYAFLACPALKSVTIPSTVTEFGYYYDWNTQSPFAETDLQLIEFKGPPPANVGGSSFSGRTIISKAYGAAWIKAQGINNFKGFGSGSGIFTVEVISSSIRENDPTIMDVVYKVTSKKPTVKVRVLAFEDGTRSFANVVRPETLIEGTAANVGDSVTPNVEHTISWRVSSDWQTKLAKLQIEVFACEGELLPLEYMTIPASDTYGKMTVTWNAISERQWLDALFWLYASKDTGLKLEDGKLMQNDDSRILVNGTSVSYTQRDYGYWWDNSYTCYASTPAYVYGKMGYTVLADEALTYANDELRLGLSPSGARQYGYKIEK